MQLPDRHRSAIEGFLDTPSYRPCLFLICADVIHLKAMAEAIQSDYGWPCLAIGDELSRALLDVMPRQRPYRARQWVQAQLASLCPGPVLCTAIDLLFEPVFQLDPLHLFWEASRQTRLLVAWPGAYQDGVLAYATPEHAHYRTWREPVEFVIRL